MENINALDKENMRQVILDSPWQFQKGIEIAGKISAEGNFNSLTISGMGGSNLPGDILRTYLESQGNDLEIIQNRTYCLPKKAHKNSLNFFLSYSGNTEETIASLKEAIEKKLSAIGFATGGEMAKLCQENNIPCIILPAGIQPRYATGYFFGAMIQVLKNSGLIEENPEKLIALSEKISRKNSFLEERGQEIATILKGKTPIIYTTDQYKALAMIIKIKINENAKTPAFWNYYPELNHNEMVGFTLPQTSFHILSFLDQAEHPQNIKRMKITSELLEKKGIATTFLEMDGENAFEKIFSSLLLGDWISYYLALSYGQDPTPVKMVEDLKKSIT